MSIGCWWIDRSNNIHFPHLKWPSRRRWMKMTWCLMYEVIMELTSVTLSSIGDSVRDLWLEVAKPSESVWVSLVSPACTVPVPPVSLCVKDNGVRFHHTIDDIMFAWSHCNRMNHQAVCRIRWSRWTGISNSWVLDLLKSRELLYLEGLLLEFCYLQGWISNSTSHDCGRVFSLLLRLEELTKRQGMLVHLHVYDVTDVHGWYRSFWTSQSWW